MMNIFMMVAQLYVLTHFKYDSLPAVLKAILLPIFWPWKSCGAPAGRIVASGQ